MVAVDAACFFLYRSHGKGSRLQDRVHRRSNGQSVIGMIWCVGVVGESGGPVREYSFVAYLIPKRRNHLTSRSSFLLQSSRAQLIPAMPKAGSRSASKLFMFGSGSSGAKQMHWNASRHAGYRIIIILCWIAKPRSFGVGNTFCLECLPAATYFFCYLEPLCRF